MAFQSGGRVFGEDEGVSGWLMGRWSIASAAGSRGEMRTVERGVMDAGGGLAVAFQAWVKPNEALGGAE